MERVTFVAQILRRGETFQEWFMLLLSGLCKVCIWSDREVTNDVSRTPEWNVGGVPVQWNTVKSRCVFFSTAPIGLRLLSMSEWGLLLRAGRRLHLRMQIRILGEALWERYRTGREILTWAYEASLSNRPSDLRGLLFMLKPNFNATGNMPLPVMPFEILQCWKAYDHLCYWLEFFELWLESQCAGTDLFGAIKSWSARVSFKDSLLLFSFQSDLIRVPLAPAATEAPVRKRRAATDVCVPTGSLENTVKWVSARHK